MSNGDYEFVRNMDDGEFRVWLAGVLDARGHRLNAIESVQDIHSHDIDRIKMRCSGNRWIGPTVKAMLGVAIAQLLAVLGWALARIL